MCVLVRTPDHSSHRVVPLAALVVFYEALLGVAVIRRTDGSWCRVEHCDSDSDFRIDDKKRNRISVESSMMGS